VQGWVQGRTAEDVSEEWIAQTWNVSMRHRAPLDRASLIQERAAAVAEGEKNVAQIAEQLSATRNESKELGRERQRLADELLAAQVSIAEGQRGREQLTAALNEAQAVATQSEARANSLAAEIEAARGVAVERGRAALQLTADLDTALAFSAGHERDIARLSGALKSEQVATEQRDREISRLTHDLDAARVFLRDSQSEVQRLSGEVDQVQKEILRAAAERERMTGEIATVSSELAVTRNLAGTLQEQADELRADATELPGARDTLAATKVALDEARGELGRGEHRIQELSRDLQAAQARLSQAETKLARLNDEVAETKRGLGEREAKAIGLERDLNVARALLTELQATIEAQARAMNGGSAAAKRNHGGFWRAIAVRLRRSSVPDTAARQWEHEVIRKSRAFDAVWYLKQYPDVAAADQDPLWHYIRHGAAEGREPHPLFDSKWYRSQAPDLAELNMTPLGHYVSVGVSKGLDPHPLFDTDWYLEQNPDVAAAHINPLYHFMKIGCANGRDPNPLFDTSWYLEKNPDVVKARDNPLLHYDIYGWKEGRDPHPDFDTDWYLKEYSDVAESKMNPLAHFVGVGVKARYQPNKASKNNPHAVIINSSIPVFQKEETEVEVIETREAGHESPKHPNPRKDQKSQPDGFLDTGCLIVSPPHTLMLAQLFAAELSQLGFLAEVTSDLSAQDRYQHLFVFCPNVFEGMKDDYIAIQMEQTTSDRWFTDAYLEKLRRARAIIDYSIDNIEYLRSIGFEFWKLYYIPMGCMLDAPSASKDADTLVKDIDVLFYGDDQCPRRKHILAEICNHVSLKVVNNLFGNDIWSLIRRSKLVVNVHYYDSALLEIPRLCESLSLGTPVVSESSIDSAEHIEFYDAVEFVRHGDVGGLVMATKRLIADNQRYNLMVESCKRFAVARQEKFIRYFRRFLLAMNMISFASMMNKAEKYIPSITSNRGLCLTLSETPKRTKSFESLNRREFELVDGLRHPTTWIGCGLSYKFFCEVAAQRDWKTLLICEDDVNFPENYNLRKAVVDEYLQLHDGEWDLFSGFMADVSEDAKIYRVEWFKGERFVWIDRAVSMVYNIYARKVIDILSQWDSTNTDAKNNTIDRYLENKRVRVVMVYPFLVEHDESQTSSVWGFQNTQYREIISRSELVMNRLLESSASNSE
jgi:peptidoglycan hydrolase CwlO-like protein